jgi:hypothetical protein
VLGTGADDRRILAVARDVVSDVLWRWSVLGHGSGTGLHGGSYSASGPDASGNYTVNLVAVRWTTDTTVTGLLKTDPYDELMEATPEVSTPVGSAQLTVDAFHLLDPSISETIAGTIGGLLVDVQIAADLRL